MTDLPMIAIQLSLLALITGALISMMISLLAMLRLVRASLRDILSFFELMKEHLAETNSKYRS